jgi:hypothetical protein
MSEEYLHVKDNPDLVREKDSKAIINIDTEAYNRYMERKKYQNKKDEKINKLEAEVADLKKFITQLVEAGALNQK